MLTLATDVKSGGKCSTVTFFSSLSWARLFELDDGWPESVEEQSLLLLVWRHYIKDVL